jgi:hypothetical protein
MDIVPGFWRKIVELDRRGLLISVDKVRDEMVSYNDALSTWITTELSASFFKDTATILAQYAHMTAWAMAHPSYNTAAKAEFCDDKVADAWICAYALAHHPNMILLTHEKSEPDIKRKVKIPEVCVQFGMTYLNTIQMFRQLNEPFL